MTLGEMKSRIIFQLNADIADLGDYEPFIDDYVNQGYDKIVEALMNAHLGDEHFPFLESTSDTPHVPLWMHPFMADYATWLVYRNGNPQKQSRGTRYLEAFQEALLEIKALQGQYAWDDDANALTRISTKAPQFYNIPL